MHYTTTYSVTFFLLAEEVIDVIHIDGSPELVVAEFTRDFFCVKIRCFIFFLFFFFLCFSDFSWLVVVGGSYPVLLAAWAEVPWVEVCKHRFNSGLMIELLLLLWLLGLSRSIWL